MMRHKKRYIRVDACASMPVKLKHEVYAEGIEMLRPRKNGAYTRLHISAVLLHTFVSIMDFSYL